MHCSLTRPTLRFSLWVWVVFGVLSPVQADPVMGPTVALVAPSGERLPWNSDLGVVMDLDDDDGDGVPDGQQTGPIPMEDLTRIEVTCPVGCGVTVGAGARLVTANAPYLFGTVVASIPVKPAVPTSVWIQGVDDPTRGSLGPIAPLTLGAITNPETGTPHGGSAETQPPSPLREIPLFGVRITFLNGQNRPLRESGVSQEVTNNATLPRSIDYDALSPDIHNLRVQVQDGRFGASPLPSRPKLHMKSTGVGDSLSLEHQYSPKYQALRSSWVRLVGDHIDREAPGVTGHTLRVALGQRIEAHYGAGTATVGEQSFSQGLALGTGEAHTPVAEGALRFVILRHRPGGVPAVGRDEGSAVQIAREQVHIANTIWLQCGIHFGAPEDVEVKVEDPPGPSLISFSNGHGLPAKGGGVIRVEVGGVAVPALTTGAGELPVSVALRLAQSLQAAGFRTRVTENATTSFGAGPSADLVAYEQDGPVAKVRPQGSLPLSTDGRMHVHIGQVELGDGLHNFDNATARTGTLEERTLLKVLKDRDDRTVDIFVVPRFSSPSRLGEAFMSTDGSAVSRSVIMGREGIRQQRQAWTQAHELGHILLSHPYHPDNMGPDQPWRLMDADSTAGLVNGPKRLTAEECARVRRYHPVDLKGGLLRTSP